MAGKQTALQALPEYEPPTLVELGAVSELTLTGGVSGCYWNKQLGGSDGFTFMGISVPISNCSS
jgi:hypothetical protein